MFCVRRCGQRITPLHFALKCAVLEGIKLTYDAEGIDIAYPHMQVVKVRNEESEVSERTMISRVVGRPVVSCAAVKPQPKLLSPAWQEIARYCKTTTRIPFYNMVKEQREEHKMKKLRVGVIGIGDISNVYLNNLEKV